MSLSTIATRLAAADPSDAGYNDLEAQYELAMMEDSVRRRKGGESLADVFASPKPGADFVYQDSLTREQNRLIKKRMIRQDIYLHYKLNVRSINTRIRIVKHLNELIKKYSSVFGRYGVDATLSLVNADKVIIYITYDIIEKLQNLADRIYTGIRYAYIASHMRSPFQGVCLGPVSFEGCFEPMELTPLARKWLTTDRTVRDLIDYFDSRSPTIWEESFVGKGYASARIVEIYLRQYPVVEGSYKLPSLISRELGVEKVSKLQLGNFAKRRLLVKSDAVHKPYDPLDDQHRRFVDEAEIYESYIVR